jgi:hypothetical protein
VVALRVGRHGGPPLPVQTDKSKLNHYLGAKHPRTSTAASAVTAGRLFRPYRLSGARVAARAGKGITRGSTTRGGEDPVHRERDKEIRRRRKRREKALKRRIKERKAQPKKS